MFAAEGMWLLSVGSGCLDGIVVDDRMSIGAVGKGIRIDKELLTICIMPLSPLLFVSDRVSSPQ